MRNLVPFNKRKDELLPIGFQNMLDDFFADGWPFTRSLAGDTFKIDIKENDNEYTIDAELPGITKEEVFLSFEDGTLKLGFNKEEVKDESTDHYIHKERRSSSALRNIYLKDATAEGIKARLDNGVLNVIVPKKAHADNAIQIEVE
ncbi:MAG TPA: Hsp20 family protein [Candidatus Avacidaminococcus intestinavium]|uniref:Hsp20 family protein n=1 Tax=Candidatus Avacidaminococcus intestinavium TaxID=2840684 RepID=A0A9D1MQ59_9FIRM|nr:Hsp20 family protein [Candidatus Avacidaminococcus intestinavium]